MPSAHPHHPREKMIFLAGYGPDQDFLDLLYLAKNGLKKGIQQAVDDGLIHPIEGVSVLVR